MLNFIKKIRGLFGKKVPGASQQISRIVPVPAPGTVREDQKPGRRRGQPSARQPRPGQKPLGPQQPGPRQRSQEKKQIPLDRRPAGERKLPQRERRQPVIPPVAPPPPAPPWHVAEFDVPALEGKTRFHDLALPEEIMHAIADLGFQYCTPVQAGILPKALTGLDATGRAQTGTGKTAAFLIAILAHMLRNPLPEKPRSGTPRALILAPTRELVLQIEKDAVSLSRYLPFNIVAVFGGMDYNKQLQQLQSDPVDIVVATPGRLLDFKRRGNVHLNKVEILVIDEADRMLDMGFIPDMRRIIESTPPKNRRQTMFFSATLTPEVNRLAVQWTREPAIVEIQPEKVTVDAIDQIVYIATMEEKFTLLYNMITRQNLERVIVFCNRRDETQALKDRLSAYGISCGLLSGDVEQKQRIRTLEDFREGKIRILVATDVAARGLHIDAVSHVVNYNLPLDAEDYVHRIGRTGRAGASGISVSFASEDDAYEIPNIEKFLGRELRCVYPDADLLTAPPAPAPGTSAPVKEGGARPGGQHRRPRRRGGRPGPQRGDRK